MRFPSGDDCSHTFSYLPAQLQCITKTYA